MDHDHIRTIFKEVYNGAKNFMTPEVLSYSKKGKLIFEVSKGKGVFGGMLYGVTVIELPDKKREDLSSVFGSLDEVTDHIKELGNG